MHQLCVMRGRVFGSSCFGLAFCAWILKRRSVGPERRKSLDPPFIGIHRFQEGKERSSEDRPEGLTGLPEGNCCKRVGIWIDIHRGFLSGFQLGAAPGSLLTRVEVCVSYL